MPNAGPAASRKRAALLHIAHDVLDIGLRDHAAAAVAVEDDEVELVELDVEQLADRKGDQRQFADRRAVLLFRRAQDGEMDEIDRRVGFEDVAPHPLAGMRLARHQQHACSRSRTPLMTTTARLLISVSSCGPGSTSSSRTLGPPWSIGIASGTSLADRHHLRVQRSAVLAPGQARLRPGAADSAAPADPRPARSAALPCRPDRSSALA